MKKALLSFLAILFCFAVFPQDTTYVVGSIGGMWKQQGSPYLIQGMTFVPNGETLVIEAGVVVEWQDSYPMYIEGRILAEGTANDSILFTAANPDTGFRSIRFIDTPMSNDSSRFEYCIFRYGKVYDEWPGNSGGAIAAYQSGKIFINHCLFENNEALTLGADLPGGGAIAIWGCDPVIKNSTFRNNNSLSGGAIICYEEANPTIYGNLFKNNLSYVYGGAISIILNCSPDIINNIFHGNTANMDGGAILMAYGCHPLIDHNLMYANTSLWLGGAIELGYGCSPSMTNNTIAHNHALGRGGGLLLADECESEVKNNILWGNTADTSGSQIHIWDAIAEPHFLYNDIEGGQEEIGGFPATNWEENIDEDPLFIDEENGDYHLEWLSACIDSGDPEMLDPDGTRCDMGAFFYDQIGVGLSDSFTSNSTIEIDFYPNPVKCLSVVSYQLPVAGNVTIEVSDIAGKKKAVVVNQLQPKGKQEVQFDVSALLPGIYFVRLQSNNHSVTKKLIKH